ncbi:hypothetical protein CEXT_401341 [Caerostris extrusa]|uniref:Uncharacterized protein n=1 Tax=Caerostris extrusa TaxID=172846 RepID=A0AAV4PQ79_CAEEX|nr:hypothetical protein CEXT_401341 [Caerostris extrusa]
MIQMKSLRAEGRFCNEVCPNRIPLAVRSGEGEGGVRSEGVPGSESPSSLLSGTNDIHRPPGGHSLTEFILTPAPSFPPPLVQRCSF